MSREQRFHDNYALLAALTHAKSLNCKPVVVFNLYPDVKNRSKEQLYWMLEGLKEVEIELKKIGVEFQLNQIEKGFQKSVQIKQYIDRLNPSAVYLDFNSLKGSRSLNRKLASILQIPVYEVDGRNIVPAWISSQKEEYQAATFRPKIFGFLHLYLVDDFKLGYPVFDERVIHTVNWDEAFSFVAQHYPSRPQTLPNSGFSSAKLMLNDFLENRLTNYSKERNNPNEAAQSGLSPYLHYGQISSLRVSLSIISFLKEKGLEVFFDPSRNKARRATEGLPDLVQSAEAFLEELIVRREISENFCFYNKNYDNYLAAKDWAKASIEKHKLDSRQYLYSFEEFENAQTHDEAWNAAQVQMKKVGKMHGYMRMYWAKKILEWTPNVQTALEYAIKLNDMYELDGKDPNGYAGIAWSILGIHDRPWFEREIYGNIRYMNFEGLKKKFDVDKYIRMVKEL